MRRAGTALQAGPSRHGKSPVCSRACPDKCAGRNRPQNAQKTQQECRLMRHSFFIVLKRLFRQTGRRQSGLKNAPAAAPLHVQPGECSLIRQAQLRTEPGRSGLYPSAVLTFSLCCRRAFAPSETFAAAAFFCRAGGVNQFFFLYMRRQKKQKNLSASLKFLCFIRKK